MRSVTRRRSLVLAAALSLVWGCAATAASSERSELLRELESEVATARDLAYERLEQDLELTDDDVRAALADAGPHAQPLLLRLAARRDSKALVPDIVGFLGSADLPTRDAAVRALVTLGPEAVQAGEIALAAAGPEDADAEEAAAIQRHLRALHVQRTIERDVLSRWRRKGGSYEGRYDILEKHGWPVQPVLLAMLLDVPLRDHHLLLPASGEPEVVKAAKMATLADIALSDDRGYRTFDPLPWNIEVEDLFVLAAQALRDVGDIALLDDILEDTSQRLQDADERADRRLRPVEKYLYRDIDEVLAALGRPERLETLAEKLHLELQWFERRVRRDDDPDLVESYVQMATELAGVRHQLRDFQGAADLFQRAIDAQKLAGSKEPAITGYNRACALARGGRHEEALAQLARALDDEVSAGFEDLTREWVLEDGDLAVLHSDPRFDEIVRKRFGAAVPAVPPGDSPR